MEMGWCFSLHWGLFVDVLAMRSEEKKNGRC